MKYRSIIASFAAVAMCVAGCNRSAPEEAPANKSQDAPSATNSSVNIEGDKPQYKSHEGNVYYYESQDGKLVGVIDMGIIKQSPDPYQLAKPGDQALMIDGGLIAVTTPGSAVVRVLRRQGMGAVLVTDATLPLDGDSIVAIAMRDALAGRLANASPSGTTTPSSTTEAAGSDSDPSYSPAYKSCMESGDAADGVTQAMVECTNEELSRQDARLNKAYATAMSAKSPEAKAELRNAQRAWIKLRDSKCQEEMTGGTMDQLNESGCHLKFTYERANEIESIR